MSNLNGILDYDFRYNEGDRELEILEDRVHPHNYPDWSDRSSGWRLDMIVKINSDGDLDVIDTTPYEEWDVDGLLGDNWAGLDANADKEPSWRFIVLERIISQKTFDDSELIGLYGKNNVNTIPDLRNDNTYEVPGNGLYHYQKIIIPYENAMLAGPHRLFYDEISNKICETVDGQLVVHDDWNSVFNANGSVSDGFVDGNDFDELFNLIVDKQFNGCFYYSCNTFSMYDLVECYVLKERARLQELLKNGCSGECTSKVDSSLDILLAAIIVIDNLIKLGNFFEAQRILDSLHTCNGLCKDVRNKLKDCGCGRD